MDEKYANSITLSFGAYDMCTVFKKESPMRSQKGEMTNSIEDVAVIRMSLHLAKAYYVLLGQQLEIYEKGNGAIPIPAELAEQIKTNSIN